MYGAAGECRLQYVGCIHGAGSGACPDEGMYLVDEDDDIGVLFNLFYQGADTFFELSAVFRACHNPCQVERYDTFVKENWRCQAVHNELCESFNDGAFSHTGLSYEYRIVLLAPA